MCTTGGKESSKLINQKYIIVMFFLNIQSNTKKNKEIPLWHIQWNILTMDKMSWLKHESP